MKVSPISANKPIRLMQSQLDQANQAFADFIQRFEAGTFEWVLGKDRASPVMLEHDPDLPDRTIDHHGIRQDVAHLAGPLVRFCIELIDPDHWLKEIEPLRVINAASHFLTINPELSFSDFMAQTEAMKNSAKSA